MNSKSLRFLFLHIDLGVNQSLAGLLLYVRWLFNRLYEKASLYFVQ